MMLDVLPEKGLSPILSVLAGQLPTDGVPPS